MKVKSKRSPKSKPPSKDMLENYAASPWYSVGKILETSTQPKVDVMETFKPTKSCVDYNIEETWVKMQKGDIKVNVKQTEGSYKDIPPEICKHNQKKIRVQKFSGGPPQWKFIDERWREHVDKLQAQYKIEYDKHIKEVHEKREKSFDGAHANIQRLVGPDWFMELSPKQLAAIDQLKLSVLLDIANKSTMNCQEILAKLGLVLRANENHIRIALKHSCGCPIEFLLVLYQILNPSRTKYSLNDRLLLSSVVHLSIMPTLRELHVRIPSPPRVATKTKEKAIAKKDQNKKKGKYKSPYLEPQTYQPQPPKFSGIYKDKHRQLPESPYFAYLPLLEQEKQKSFYFEAPAHSRKNEEIFQRMKEYNNAQEFYESLPGVKKLLLRLVPPSIMTLCPNMLNAKKRQSIRKELIATNLRTVYPSEPVVCYCNERCGQGESRSKMMKRSICEKRAQMFLGTLCFCDDCLEKVAQKNLIRIHGGFLKSSCRCDDPIPIIQGTLLNRACECYKEYRNKIVSCAAKQRLVDDRVKRVLGGVVMTALGPVYCLTGTKGYKICLCKEIMQRKVYLKALKGVLLKNEAKFIIGGVTMTQQGPVYNLTSAAARKPCECILRYRDQLRILEIQNNIQINLTRFVNNGLVRSKLGPIFYLSCVTDLPAAGIGLNLRGVCSCEIKKPICLKKCLDYLEYRTMSHDPEPTASETNESSTQDDSTLEEDTSEDISKETEDHKTLCSLCQEQSKNRSSSQYGSRSPFPSSQPSCKKQLACHPKAPCMCINTDTSSKDTEESSDTSSDKSLNEKNKILGTCGNQRENDNRICKCQDELDRFMKSKCLCDECNEKIRKSYATYVMGGTKTTASGNQISMVQGVSQPLCGCLKQHSEEIKKINEYKARVQARYNLRKQPKKFCICGVKNTPQGPVYIISGMRPPVECECAKALKEKEEMEKYERQRAKPPNTGRQKFEIAGVKAMSGENIYIMSRALKMPPCECEKLLTMFEYSHKRCLEEFEKYMDQAKDELKAVQEEDQEPRELVQQNLDLAFANAFENYPAKMGFHPIFLHPHENVKNDQDNQEECDDAQDEKQDDCAKPPEPANESPYNNDFGQASEPGSKPLNEKAHKVEDKTATSSDHQTESDSQTTDDTDSGFCCCREDEESADNSEESDTGSCHVDNPPNVRPIEIPQEKSLKDSFMSKRFAIFRNIPKSKATLMGILKHILQGMAEDGFPLAKLPQAYKLPIFKLWIEMRMRISWDMEDKQKYYGQSQCLWRHTDICFKMPGRTKMPYTLEEAETMTWKHAKRIRREAAERLDEYYRSLKHTAIDAGREFFAATYSYEFPFSTWRDCAFAYLPTKEEDLFPYKIVRPSDARFIPENRRLNCYC